MHLKIKKEYDVNTCGCCIKKNETGYSLSEFCLVRQPVFVTEMHEVAECLDGGLVCFAFETGGHLNIRCSQDFSRCVEGIRPGNGRNYVTGKISRRLLNYNENLISPVLLHCRFTAYMLK